MEYGLGQDPCSYHPFDGFGVLILVLMEYGLGRTPVALQKATPLHVLILVLMEYGLGPGNSSFHYG